MVSSTTKAVILSTGVTAVALFLKASIPMAVDFSLSRSPILWSFFLSCLKPPYLFVVIHVIVAIVIASSSYHDGDDEDDQILDAGDCKIIQTEQIVHQAPPRRLEVKDVDLDADLAATFPPPISIAEVERSEEISGLINGGDEFVVVTSKLNQVQPTVEESENLPPAEKPLLPARSGHRKPVKTTQKDSGETTRGEKRKVLRVAKPKRPETALEAWKTTTEDGKSTALTSHYRRSETFGVDAGHGEAQPPALRKSVTFRDMTNYQKSPTVTPPPVKMKKEMSPSREELNRRVEAFIKKFKEERLESLRLDKA